MSARVHWPAVRRVISGAVCLLALAGAARAQDPLPPVGPVDEPARPQIEGAASEARGMDDSTLDALDSDAPVDLADRLRIFKQARVREQEIKRLEASMARSRERLDGAKTDIEARYKALRLLQEELSALVDEDAAVPPDQAAAAEDRREQVTEEKVKRLSKVFDKMKPAEAAKVIEQMDEMLVEKVLARLKARQAAKILGSVTPDLAARLSERMAKVREGKKRRRSN